MKMLRIIFYITTIFITTIFSQNYDKNLFSKYFIKEKEVSLQTENLNIGTFWGIVTDSNENIILLDAKGRQVLVFNQDGRFIRRIGKQGQGPGEHQNPSTIWSDKKGNVFIGDHSTRRINKYDKNGDYISSFITTSGHWQAISIRADLNGDLYLGGLKPDQFNNSPGTWINKYTREGKYIKSFYNDNLKQAWVRMISRFDFDIYNDQIYAIMPNKYEISIFKITGKLIKTVKKKPSYIKELDSKIKFSRSKYQNPNEMIKKLKEISKSWNKILRIKCFNEKYLLLFIETNDLIKDVSTKYIIDVLDLDGNLLIGKIPTDYQFLYADYDNKLYFLTFTDEDDVLTEDPEYKIGIFCFRDLK